MKKNEDFVALVQLENTTAANEAIKYALLRLDQFENCRGQVYDGARNFRVM